MQPLLVVLLASLVPHPSLGTGEAGRQRRGTRAKNTFQKRGVIKDVTQLKKEGEVASYLLGTLTPFPGTKCELFGVQYCHGMVAR